jgi:hypothetical protein
MRKIAITLALLAIPLALAGCGGTPAAHVASHDDAFCTVRVTSGRCVGWQIGPLPMEARTFDAQQEARAAFPGVPAPKAGTP